jgi:Fic family protein
MTDRASGPAPESQATEAPYESFPDFEVWRELSARSRETWTEFASSFEARRRQASEEDFTRAVNVAVRAAAVDTAAIEGLYDTDRGFTRSVAFQAAAWEQAFAERGGSARRFFEAQLRALELVLDAVTKKLPITEAWIRALHEKLCEPQETYRVYTDQGWQDQPLPKGRYKLQPNSPTLRNGTRHAYAPLDQVPIEMHRLVELIQGPTFQEAHPVLQASYVHYALVAIHPFADGNGRVARALASTFFYRAHSIPLLVFADQRTRYLDGLEAADAGDYRPIARFFLDRGIDTMGLIMDTLTDASEPSLHDVTSRLHRMFFDEHELTHEEIDRIGLRLLSAIQDEIMERFNGLKLSKSISLSFPKESTLSLDPVEGFRFIKRAPPPLVYLTIKSAPPADALISSWIRVLVTDDTSRPFVFVVQAPPSKTIRVRLEDVHPEISASLRARVGSLTERVLAELLHKIEKQAAESLKKSGR